MSSDKGAATVAPTAAERDQLAKAERDLLLARALRHYANEDNWEDVSLLAEGYSVWEYCGGHDPPWAVAREALTRTEQP